MNKVVFVQNVKNYCKMKGVKPTVACRESGVGASFINNIAAKGQVPSVERVQMLAAYFGITTSELLGEKIKPTPEEGGGQGGEADPLRSTLLHNFDQLNQEGRERLVETSDDMVSSGKYIKSDPAGLGKEA